MTSTTSSPEFRPRLWAPGDWNAFFGFGTNILVNMLTKTILLRWRCARNGPCAAPYYPVFHVAGMLHGLAGSGSEPLKIQGNILQHTRHISL